MGKKSGTADDYDDHDHDDLPEIYSRIKVNPEWNRFQILVEVAEGERIKLEDDRREREFRQNLSTNSLKIADEKETEESIGNDLKKRVVELQLPFDQYSNIAKGKRSLRKKRIFTQDKAMALFEKDADRVPLYEFEGRHEEKDSNCSCRILFSYGDIIKNRCKRWRSNEENGTDQEEERSRPKKTKKNNRNYLDAPLIRPTITIPEIFKNKIVELGGVEASLVFVFQKVLTKTDVNPHHQRLLIPFNQIKNGFLTDEEERRVEKKFEVDAIFVDPSLDECRINLKQWNMPKLNSKVNYNYSLVTHWSKVVRKNHLTEGMTIDLWAFRRDSKLGLALIPVN